MLKIDNMNISYDGVPVVRDFSLDINKREIIGIVGESGSGKSTLLKSLMGLLSNDGEIESGEVFFEGKNILNKKELEKICGKDISMVFQQPTLHLDPISRIGDQFYEVMKNTRKNTTKSKRKHKEEIEKEVIELLQSLNLSNPHRILKSFPFELSGGINQRVYLALAMVNKPKILLADEPTSALDVTVQLQVVQTMKHLRDKFDTSILMVSHNLGVISNIADRIGIMYLGRLVEIGTRDEIINNPKHQYTKALLNAIPNLSGEMPKGIKGRIPDFGDNIKGCPFYSRCEISKDSCRENYPKLNKISNKHFVHCNSLI